MHLFWIVLPGLLFETYIYTLVTSLVITKEYIFFLQFWGVFLVGPQGLPGNVGMKGEKGSSATDVVGAKVQVYPMINPFTRKISFTNPPLL